MRLLQRPTSAILAVLMLSQATGCTHWKTVSLSAAAVENPKKKVQVVLKEGGTITTDSVRARGDSVVTYQAAGVGTVPLEKVEAVKVERSNSAVQVAILLGIVVGLFVWAKQAAKS